LPEANQPPEVAEQLKKQCKARDIHSPEDLSFLEMIIPKLIQFNDYKKVAA
jgi:hypothetical protein